MSPFEMLRFGIDNMIQKPTFMKYGMKNHDKVLDKLVKNPTISTIIYGKAFAKMVYMGYAYRWEVMRRQSVYYPCGGMQSLPNEAVKTLQSHGGTLKLKTQVTEILMENGKASGVKTKAGETYDSKEVISNISPDYTMKLLPEPMRTSYEKKIFPSCAILFMGVRGDFDFQEMYYQIISPSEAYSKEASDYTKENVPIGLIVANKPEGQKDYSVMALAPLPYEFEEAWRTEGGQRGEIYKKLKEEVLSCFMNRITEALGEDFKQAVLFAELSTPLTFERYLQSQKGSFMGWAIDEKSYGKFLSPKTKVTNVHLVGQWVFPGFGVAGVMAGGYYLAKDLLKKEGMDLEKEYKAYFEGLK